MRKKMIVSIKKYADAIVLLPGTATDILRKQITPHEIKAVTSMKEAVQTAYRIAGKGDWVILSPGAASFGLFLNEFDRGAQFVKEVKKLR